jgi:hypothetical protein
MNGWKEGRGRVPCFLFLRMKSSYHRVNGGASGHPQPYYFCREAGRGKVRKSREEMK